MECAYSAETPVSKPDDNTSNWLCMKEAALKGYVLQHPFVERGDLPSPSARLPLVTSLLSGPFPGKVQTSACCCSVLHQQSSKPGASLAGLALY